MFVYVVRHAWAGHYGDPQWPDDFERPLTAAGQTRFAQVTRKLVERGFAPGKIATSPLVRCRQTADILAQFAPGRPAVEELEALGIGADFDDLIRWTSSQDEQEVAWVGHAPCVGHLVAALIGDGRAGIRFAKGACSAVRFSTGFRPGGGELYWHTTAKLLGC